MFTAVFSCCSWLATRYTGGSNYTLARNDSSMKTLPVVTLTHVLLKLVDAVPLASFFFGPTAGDTSLPRNDKEYLPLISLSTAFPTLEPKSCICNDY